MPVHATTRDRLGIANTTAFEVSVEQVLAPSLHAGQIVVMDNLQAHKSAFSVAEGLHGQHRHKIIIAGLGRRRGISQSWAEGQALVYP